MKAETEAIIAKKNAIHDKIAALEDKCHRIFIANGRHTNEMDRIQEKIHALRKRLEKKPFVPTGIDLGSLYGKTIQMICFHSYVFASDNHPVIQIDFSDGTTVFLEAHIGEANPESASGEYNVEISATDFVKREIFLL